MKKRNKFSIVLCTVMASLVMGSAITSTFAYWDKEKGELNIPTTEFNSTSDEFTYFACVPSISSTFGYDYYDLSQIPEDLVDNVEGLAVVRFEAITKTCFIPPYPQVSINGNQYNYNGKKELPVIHVINSLHYDDVTILNGFDHIESLIIPETITYMQHGSLNGSTGLTEVAVLGDETSGPFYYSSSEKNLTGNIVNIRYQHENRDKGSENAYEITTPTSKNAKFQFESSRMHYDNLNNMHATFIIPNADIEIVKIDTPNAPAVSYNVELTANVKYKLLFDGTTLTAKEYTYKLDTDISDANNALIPLVLNTNVEHEEYILDPNSYPFSVINIPNNPTISVIEYIDGVESKTSTFNLNDLNASYSRDNSNYEIKFSPDKVYESIHYRQDTTGNDIKVKTQTQISVEKAYFLNNVTQENEEISNRVVRTISVPSNGYLGLYVEVDNGTVDPNTGSPYIKMNYENGYYSYSFTANEGNLPTSYVFYDGKYSVISYPSYISKATQQSHIEEAMNYSTTNYIYYFDVSSAGLSSEDKIVGNNSYPEYEWYAIYWDENDVQGEQRLSYIDGTDLIRVSIPNTATKFKFARVNYGVDIDTALANDWAGVERQSSIDILPEYLDKYNQNYIVYTGCSDDGYVSHNYCFVDIGSNERRIYFDNTMMGSAVHNDDINVDSGDSTPDYRWYVVYWINENNEDKRYTEPLSYCVADATKNIYRMAIDIPYNAYKFKLVRIPYATDINVALTGNWENVTNQNENDIMIENMASFNTVVFTAFYENGNGRFNYTLDTLEIPQSYKPLNQAYLILNDYGQTGNEVYMRIDQNLNYTYGTTVGDTLKYEFYKKVNPNASTIQNVSFTSGTLLTAKIANPVTGIMEEIALNEVTCTEGYESYFELNGDGALQVNNDVVAKFYIKVDYNSSTGVLTNASVYMEVVVDESISGFVRQVVMDEEVTIESGNITTNNVAVSGTYKILTTQSSQLLVRNHANTEYEEYYIYNEAGNLGNFVVSKYNAEGTKFGYSYTNKYYGTYSSSSTNPLGYLVATANDKIIKFSPNANGVITTTLDLTDSNGNIINGLSYSSSVSEYYGKDIYIVNIPQIYGETYNITNEAGEDLLTDILSNASLDTTKLKNQYYLNSLVDTNSFFKEDDEYYAYLGRYVGENETLTVYNNQGNVVTINNNNESLKLDYSIIDGYYYSGLTINNNQITLPAPGYYDLRIYVINGNAFFGYKYLGEELLDDGERYFLNINDESLLMNRAPNRNYFYLDIYLNEQETVSIVDNHDLVIGNSIALSAGLTRVYASLNNNASWTNDYVIVSYSYITRLYSPGDNVIETTTFNVYTTTGAGIPNYVRTSDDTIYSYTSSSSLAGELLQIDESTWGNYVIVNTNGDTIIVNETDVTIPYSGNYYIEYDGTEITYSKVEESKDVNLLLGEEVIDTLEIRDTTSLVNEKYLEYTLDEYIVIEEAITLTSTPYTIVDSSGYVMSLIEKVTLVTSSGSTSTTVIPAGVYQLTYSVDSFRRDTVHNGDSNYGGSNYKVFTYLKLVEKENSEGTITYNIPDGNGGYTTYTQIINTTHGTALKTYASLGGEVPENNVFIGWGAAAGSTTIKYNDGQVVTNSSPLYPMFKTYEELFSGINHDVVYLVEPTFDSTSEIIFTLENLEGYTISGIYSQKLGDVDAYDKYYNVTNNVITINPTIFELVGNVDGGQYYVVTFTNGFSIEIQLDYPNYQNDLTNQ